MKLRAVGFREEGLVVRATFQKDGRVFDVLRAVLEELRFSPREYDALLNEDVSSMGERSEWFSKDGLDILVFVSTNKIWVIGCGQRYTDLRNTLKQYIET